MFLYDFLKKIFFQSYCLNHTEVLLEAFEGALHTKFTIYYIQRYYFRYKTHGSKFILEYSFLLYLLPNIPLSSYQTPPPHPGTLGSNLIRGVFIVLRFSEFLIYIKKCFICYFCGKRILFKRILFGMLCTKTASNIRILKKRILNFRIHF